MKRLLAFSINMMGVAAVLLIITHLIAPSATTTALMVLSVLWCFSVVAQCFSMLNNRNRKGVVKQLRFQ